MDWKSHFTGASGDFAFGDDLFTMEFQDVNAPSATTPTAAQEVLQIQQKEDKPIELTGLQKAQQAVMQTTGQLNAAGTAPGPGFFGTTLGHVAIAAGVFAGLAVLGPVLGPMLMAGRSFAR